MSPGAARAAQEVTTTIPVVFVVVSDPVVLIAVTFLQPSEQKNGLMDRCHKNT